MRVLQVLRVLPPLSAPEAVVLHREPELGMGEVHACEQSLAVDYWVMGAASPERCTKSRTSGTRVPSGHRGARAAQASGEVACSAPSDADVVHRQDQLPLDGDC